MIQTQYDAALKNPPWEQSNTFDIDDRPKKKRKPWYFEVVRKEDGRVVETIDEDIDVPKQPEDASLDPQQQPRRSSRSRSANTTTSNSRSSTPSIQLSDDSSLSSCPSRIFEPSFLKSNDESSVTSTEEKSASRPSSSHSSNASHSSQPNHISSEHTIVPIVSTQPTAPRISTLQREESSFMSTTSVESSNPTSSQSSSRSLPNLKGRDLFDAQIWQDPQKTSIHYMFISSLRNKVREVATTTEIHKFIRTLRDGGKLVRNYTQNIDLLEEREGLSTEISKGPGNKSRFNPKTQRELRPQNVTTESPHFGGCEVVPLHGTLAGLRCPLCREHTSWDEPATLAATLSGTAPDCPSCTAYSARRTSHGRRGFSIGRLRPDIVLYGEEHPNANLIGEMVTHDLGLGPDVLLIIGTSLRVHGLKVMIREFAKSVHSRGGKVVFVNRTKPPESTWGDVIDYWVEWDCDAWVLDLKRRRRDIWLPQGVTPSEESKKKEIKEATIRPPASTQRPQCLRDDKMNAIFITFKILDQLRPILDEQNKTASRPIYWKPFSRRSTLPPAAPSPPEPVKKPISKAPRKSLPTSKPLLEPATAKSIQSKKRKSEPASLQLKENQVIIVSEAWDNLRKKFPNLPKLPPELRQPLSLFESNKKPSYLTPFQPSNHYPNVGGGSSWPLEKMNLATHPPSGPPIAGLVPKAEVKRPPPTHSYGTRARGKPSSTITIDCGKVLPPSTEDTIIITPVDEPQGESRIKRMSSIGNIVSGVSSPSSEAFYSAEETINEG